MTFKTQILFQFLLAATILFCCTERKNTFTNKAEIKSLDLQRGDITLCGSGTDQFGSVSFDLACSDKVKTDFNVATALLHSFEYTEAEKMFAKVIDQDSECVMAYWGAAMSIFHPLWAPPSLEDLERGNKIITVARSIVHDTTSKESAYLETIATIYDEWGSLDHKTRMLKFERASEKLFKSYPEDREAAIFYALALGASADPSDKSFRNQKKAGQILNSIFDDEPNHPGIAHYIIHNFDYPELAELALPAARKYASIAAASAHAQHMPSHIFTRLGLWEESIVSNINSVSSAQCYAENLGLQGHWDEEIHGLDYLTYAYLQKADDQKAREQISYLKNIKEVFPVNFKVAYTFAAMPARYAMERRDWPAAAGLQFEPTNFPWEKFLWEGANINFARMMGAIHTRNLAGAGKELAEIKVKYEKLLQAKEAYKANLLLIQIKTGEAWINLKKGKREAAFSMMQEAADMEDATAKHPVTPGEIIPARELLGDLYMEAGDFTNALLAYEEDLKRHPNRFNALYGAGMASKKSGDLPRAKYYYEQLIGLIKSSAGDRPQIALMEEFLSQPK